MSCRQVVACEESSWSKSGDLLLDRTTKPCGAKRRLGAASGRYRSDQHPGRCQSCRESSAYQSWGGDPAFILVHVRVLFHTSSRLSPFIFLLFKSCPFRPLRRFNLHLRPRLAPLDSPLTSRSAPPLHEKKHARLLPAAPFISYPPLLPSCHLFVPPYSP